MREPDAFHEPNQSYCGRCRVRKIANYREMAHIALGSPKAAHCDDYLDQLDDSCEERLN